MLFSARPTLSSKSSILQRISALGTPYILAKNVNSLALTSTGSIRGIPALHLFPANIEYNLSFTIMLSGNGLHSTQKAHAAITSTTLTSSNIIAHGERFMGVPYRFGSKSGQTRTFDCSSFTQYVYKQNGISLPRSSKQQSQVGTYVPRNQLQPGDLIFFYSPIHHVGIYIGNGNVLHTFGAPGVTISNMKTGWWSNHYNTARRVLPANSK